MALNDASSPLIHCAYLHALHARITCNVPIQSHSLHLPALHHQQGWSFSDLHDLALVGLPNKHINLLLDEDHLPQDVLHVFYDDQQMNASSTTLSITRVPRVGYEAAYTVCDARTPHHLLCACSDAHTNLLEGS